MNRGKKKTQKSSKGKSSVARTWKMSQEAPKTQKVSNKWDNIPGILDDGENSYKPTGIHREFLGFAKIFRTVEKSFIP